MIKVLARDVYVGGYGPFDGPLEGPTSIALLGGALARRLLMVLAGRATPTRGKVYYADTRMAPSERELCAYVGEEPRAWPPGLTLEDRLALDGDRVLLERCAIHEHGRAREVALALGTRRDLVMLQEPLVGVGAATDALRTELFAAARTRLVVFATASTELAARADRVVQVPALPRVESTLVQVARGATALKKELDGAELLSWQEPDAGVLRVAGDKLRAAKAIARAVRATDADVRAITPEDPS